MRNLIVLLFLFNTAYGQMPKGGTTGTFLHALKCSVAHADGICSWEKPDNTKYRDTARYPIWVIWCLKKGNSVVFASPGIHVNGVDLIHWKNNRYKPIPKTRKVITIIK